MNILNSKKMNHYVFAIFHTFFWFAVGATFGLFLFISFVFIYFQTTYTNDVYPNIFIEDVNFGGKSKEEVAAYFQDKNQQIAQTKLVFTKNDNNLIVNAEQLNFGYNASLLADQAYSIGRSDDIVSNISMVFQAYIYGIFLPPSYHFSYSKLENLLSPLTDSMKVEPVDALFSFQNGKVSAFRLSSEGQEANLNQLQNAILTKIPYILSSHSPEITFEIPIKILKPQVTTDQANNLGIRELIGTGTSIFKGSIENRRYNISLAAERVNGILVAPNETFSFNKALGDVSTFTGFKQAYVIQNGHTVLGDGGGVCQVSTTFFRALLSAGLPITERNPHAYRVGYYEQDSPPGFDATIYVPNIDLKFRNDTGNHILIQSYIDPINMKLTYMLYGTKDERQVEISQPTITGQVPAPEPAYQDDPTLAKGTVKQIDFAASGAKVSFTRSVKINGKVIISETFVSNYRPWQAVYARGTKE